MTDFWETVERIAAVITILQATPKVITMARRLITDIKKRFSKSRRKLK